VSALLAGLLALDPELGDPVLEGMSGHGIGLNASNVALRERA
jgi:hypothetical protein